MGLSETGIKVTPHTGVWIETSKIHIIATLRAVTPHTGVWIETELAALLFPSTISHPPYGGVD